MGSRTTYPVLIQVPTRDLIKPQMLQQINCWSRKVVCRYAKKLVQNILQCGTTARLGLRKTYGHNAKNLYSSSPENPAYATRSPGGSVSNSAVASFLSTAPLQIYQVAECQPSESGLVWDNKKAYSEWIPPALRALSMIAKFQNTLSSPQLYLQLPDKRILAQ